MPLRSSKHPAPDEELAAPAPTPPSVTSITFDQASYTPGQVITATVTYQPGTSTVSQSFTGTATAGGQAGTLTASFAVVTPQPTTVSAADSGDRAWTQKAAAGGSVAVFTAVA